MSTKFNNFTNEPANEPIVFVIKLERMKYSEVKLFIATEIKGNKKIPSVAAGKRWYVYFYYMNPKNGKMEKFQYYHGINKYKTVSKRKSFGKNLLNTEKFISVSINNIGSSTV